MLNLSHFETFCHRLPIKDRDTGLYRRFEFNTSQKKIMAELYRRREKGYPLWLIFLKARRLGISTFVRAMLIAQQLQKKNCQGMIVAQLAETARELFNEAVLFAEALPFHLPPHTQRELYFPHSGGVSSLRRATAKTVIGGRGLTLNGLHLTEAAFYPGEQSFVALINTVSADDPDNVVVIETTANGIEGPGETYFNYWHDAVAGKNNFMPIFLPWWEDAASFLPDRLAEDAPADDYEKWLMKEFHVTKGQVAWYRQAKATKCGDSQSVWQQEYPADPSEAFLSSGNPAFDREEMQMAMKTVEEPHWRGQIRLTGIDPEKLNPSDLYQGAPTFEQNLNGNLVVWEDPQPGDHYYVGVDAAKGVIDGDFAAAVGWNAETGNQAFRYSARVGPEKLGFYVNALGRRYNNATVNIELTGGWGWAAMKELRDKWHYPTQYLWMSKDDRPDRKPRQALGWETTMNSRKRLLIVYRTSVRSGDCHPKDIETVQQMSNVQIEMAWNWTVSRGHDDVLFAAMLGWIAMIDHHFPHRGQTRNAQTFVETPHPRVEWIESPETNSLGLFSWSSTAHLEKLKLWHKPEKMRNRNLLEDEPREPSFIPVGSRFIS